MKTTSCTCRSCVGLCEKNPGWMTPADAKKAIRAGLASRLMRDWLDPCSKVGNKERIYLLCPASDDRGGEDAPEWDDMHGGGGDFVASFLNPPWKGRCTFLSNGRCDIHNSGFKPTQCASALACKSTGKDNYEMGRLWDNADGRAVIDLWRASLAKTNGPDVGEAAGRGSASSAAFNSEGENR